VFQVEITARDGATRSEVFDKPEVTIGRINGNDIILPVGNVSKRHARIVRKDDKYIVVDLKSTNGTYVNGRKLTSPLVVHEDDKIYIGNFSLVIGPADEVIDDDVTLEVDATELRLLAAIAQRDDMSRVVYADWLEERGEAARAEFLRAQELLVATAVDDPRFRERSDRMRELGAAIDVRWRYKVARPLIENCLAIEFACPRDWGSLATTEKRNVRYCGSCAKQVFYCATVDEARRHAQRGRCVAVDVVPLRHPRDLEPARRTTETTGMTMGMVMPPPRRTPPPAPVLRSPGDGVTTRPFPPPPPPPPPPRKA
jgi:uncharacterized protein (TIGR02996 family)